MKVGIFTRGRRGYFLIRELLKRHDIQIKFICLTASGYYPFLWDLALYNDIDCLIFENVNEKENIDLIKSFKCDLLISCGYDQIFKGDLLNLKIINCHGSALPKYRGRNVLKRALANGDKEFGITVHHVDSGIDTGPIIVQKLYPITKRNYRTLLNLVRHESGKVIIEAIDLLNDPTI